MADFDEVKDSGERRDFGTGSVRDVRTGKGRYDLLEPYAIKRLAQHFENGAAKYGDNNWKLGQPLSGYLDSGIRHAFNLLDGMQDEDHAAAAAWNLMAFISTQHWVSEGALPAELDDIEWSPAPKPSEEVETTEVRSFGDVEPIAVYRAALVPDAALDLGDLIDETIAKAERDAELLSDPAVTLTDPRLSWNSPEAADLSERLVGSVNASRNAVVEGWAALKHEPIGRAGMDIGDGDNVWLVRADYDRIVEILDDAGLKIAAKE